MKSNETTPKVETAYLGDGVYAKFDGYSILIYTSDGIRATNTIALEPEVIGRLQNYIQQIKDEI